MHIKLLISVEDSYYCTHIYLIILIIITYSKKILKVQIIFKILKVKIRIVTCAILIYFFYWIQNVEFKRNNQC